jgi:hypothetical protein
MNFSSSLTARLRCMFRPEMRQLAQPYDSRPYIDLACDSGDMFVKCMHFNSLFLF